MWVLMATAAAIRPECFNRHGGKVGIVCWVHIYVTYVGFNSPDTDYYIIRR